MSMPDQLLNKIRPNLQQLELGTTYKDQLFYDEYRYVLEIYMPEVNVLREQTHKSIDSALSNRQKLRQRMLDRGHGWTGNKRLITDGIRDNCHRLLNELEDLKSKFKLYISVDWMYIYTNDLDDLRRIEKLDFLIPLSLKEAKINRPKGTVILKKSKYTKRSYFRAQKLTDVDRDNLINFLSNQKDLRMAPSLNGWVTADDCVYRKNYLLDGFFIDHHSDVIITMLGLIIENPVRKTITIIQDK